MSFARCLFLVLSFVFCLLSCFLPSCPKNLPNQVQKEEQSRRVRDDLLYPERSIDHLEFFANQGYFLHTVPLCTFTFFFDCLRNEKSF